eukprot:bmy_03611T0
MQSCSLSQLRIPDLFSCFNGGECVHPAFCDCRRFNATGPRCQMVYNVGPERDSICRAWGQHHVETFDGLYYYLSGKGSYTLVGRHEPEGQTFSVQVHNDPQCGSSPYTCSRSVSLFLAGEQEIHLAKEVTHGGIRVQLPHVTGSMRLQQLAGYVLVRHQSAFTLAWDGTSAVYIKMSPEFLGWTHGLCGNNNADPQDDLVTSYAVHCKEKAFIYNECIACCPASCQPRASCVDSEITCVDGCYCPDAECSVTGDIHFTTFDGRRYTFPATCQYILAKSRSSGTFTVTLQNAPCGLNQDGVCVQSVSVILHQDPRRQVTLTQAGDVLLFDQYKVTPPYTDDAFEIRRLSSVFLRVRTNVGVRVLYDREGPRLYLQVDQRWVEDTVGLCGTFNGNTQDDFLSPVGVPESTPQLFGNSWKTLSACFPLVSGSPLDPCDVHVQAALSCEATKEYSPCVAPCGQTCQDLAGPEACGVDGGGDLSGDECVEGCACPPDTYLDTQADLCVPRNQCSCHFQGMDYPPGDSDIPSLGHCHCKDGVMSCGSRAPAAACPAGQVFVNCSDLHTDPELSRERTCEQQLLNLSLSVPARGPCLSGCACPQGLLRHGDACFLPEECPCTWKGKEYFPGDQVMSPCHSCVCQRGSFQCALHPCASTCTAYGDRHYRTFDGLPFDFVGACKVHLVKSTSDFSFSVIVENVNCYSSGIICRKFISINVGNSLIIFDDDSGNPGQLAGLCGNFDLKTINEMRTPEKLELTNPQEFGGSWATVECPDTLDPRDTCVLNPLREPFAKKECSILLSEVFETCHPVVDVTWFYSNCLTDTCGCSRGGDCECFCASVSAYAHQCCQHGVAVDWRTPRLCPYDCDFFNKALGKGPYQLASLAASGALVAMKVAGGAIVLARAEDVAPGDIVNFLLTAALYKAKAHDPDVISLEAADRPNFFLHVMANGSLELAKWQASDAFHHHASFSLHRGTWRAGLVALESLAEPGAFLYVLGPVLALRLYEHTEAFRRGTLFRLLDAKPSGAPYPTCEWRYDACASPCFQTCQDPRAASCRDVPRVEGCVPVCPTPRVLDEVTQRCVYLEDCRCSVFPDLSFVTFDGSHVALFKEAIYILSRSPDEMVTVHVLDCKSANLGHLNWPPFCLVMLNVTHLTHQVTIDRFNRKVSVDLQPVWPPVSRYGFRIEDTGHMYMIRTPSHIQIQWLHSSGLMILEASKASKAQGRGLCGICDGDTANDLTLEDGSVVGEAEDPAPFLDSWQVPSSLTSVGQTRFRPDSCATADCSPCLRMVSNHTFSACHRFVTPESFCELWIRDTKYVQQPCVALTVYVAMCHKFHVCIKWRRSDYCPFLCPSDSTYQACVAACEPPETCQDGMLGSLDPEQCQVLGEGCVCSEGTILHRRHLGLCIPEEKCACTDSTGVPRALGETWNSSLSGCCQHQCQAPDTIVPMGLGCPGPRPESCPRFGEVALLLPTEDPCCLGTVCECDPDLCEAELVPSCRQDQTLIVGRLGDSCCTFYFCACGDCPDPIPECQEGEALTVDRNTTELCCPLYQCVCESFRCPHMQCGMGTALVEVWSPDRCCPYKSCECDCDTIPVPRCRLGEKSELDEAFMHSAGNVCGCTKYECVKAPVCLSRELGVMQPGQTVVKVSAEGVCHTSHCTAVLDPLTSFYQINTTSVLCDVHCEANQEYEHPRDLAACCGSCRNVSCLFTFPNGTTSLFLPGASWIADCTRHHCSSTPLGAVLVRSPISCPPLNETECAKAGGSVVPSLEGCCRTCSPGTLFPVVPVSPASPPRVSVHCHPGKEDGRSCRKVTIRMTIRKNECRSNTPVNLVSCDGRCPSASIYNYNINTYARFCKCCREVGLQRRSVQLFCATNATWVPYIVQEPTDCACQWS